MVPFAQHAPVAGSEKSLRHGEGSEGATLQTHAAVASGFRIPSCVQIVMLS